MRGNYYFSTPRTVALYGRVSTEHEAQISAFNNQEQWLENLLERHNEWTLYDKYLDEGITGTQAYKRDEFIRMIEDARDKKFDLIVCRDVCRFARNTMDTLKYTRELKDIGVECYFVDDGIWTMDTDGEYRLTLMSANAQDESRRTSVRVKNGQEISRQKAVIYGNGNILGYERDPLTKKFVINDEQANTVRMIFELYTSGNGLRKVQFELERLGRKKSSGSTSWDCSTISRILQNTTYTGYMSYKQSFSNNFLEQKRERNYGEKELVKIDIEPIITLAQFEQAEKVRLSKKSHEVATNTRGKKLSLDIYCRKMVCECGSSFNRRKWHTTTDNEPQWGYHCYNQLKTGSKKTRENKGLSIDGVCDTKMMTEWKLNLMAKEIFKKIYLNKEEIIGIAETAITKHINDNEDIKNSDTVKSLEKELLKKKNMLDNLVDMRAEGEIDRDTFLNKKEEIEHSVNTLNEQLKEYSVENVEEESDGLLNKLKMIKYSLEQQINFDEKDRVPESIIDACVDKIVVGKNSCDWYLRLVEEPITVTTDNRRKKNGQAYIVDKNNENELLVCCQPLKLL